MRGCFTWTLPVDPLSTTFVRFFGDVRNAICAFRVRVEVDERAEKQRRRSGYQLTCRQLSGTTTVTAGRSLSGAVSACPSFCPRSDGALLLFKLKECLRTDGARDR